MIWPLATSLLQQCVIVAVVIEIPVTLIFYKLSGFTLCIILQEKWIIFFVN